MRRQGLRFLRRIRQESNGRRYYHGSATVSNVFGANSFAAGTPGASDLPPKPAPSKLPLYRQNIEKCSDSISYMKDVSLKQKNMVKKFVNLCMSDGKKTKARKLCFKTFEHLASGGDVVKQLETAIENVKPICEVKKVRVAGATHNVPAAIAKHRQETLAMRWILEASKNRWESNKRIDRGKYLADEIKDACRKAGASRKKRDDLHKLAEANRTLAHYRWW